ncbi:peptidoglycan-binding domain-containing protein [Streptomyces sp. NPDC029003]|uniref:peptidoglycan-binding domain-containing protein n=1 Tax=Streptomyces sp. NPDC029003 TaxID=3155125 RepID=UPI003405BEEC
MAEQTVQLSAVPARPHHVGSAPPRRPRRLVPLIAGGVVVVAATGVALALGLFTGSGDGDAVLLDPKPSAPAITAAPVGPSDGPTGPTPTGATPSASAGASATPSRSSSASAGASASASRTSAPPPTPSPSRTRTTSPTPAPPPPPPPAKAATLRSGDSGPEVEKLQRLLASQGYYRGRVDGRYGRSVEHAVEDFQYYNGVYEDPRGVYGPATRRALEG